MLLFSQALHRDKSGRYFLQKAAIVFHLLLEKAATPPQGKKGGKFKNGQNICNCHQYNTNYDYYCTDAYVGKIFWKHDRLASGNFNEQKIENKQDKRMPRRNDT
jgi:hypothetical protein